MNTKLSKIPGLGKEEGIESGKTQPVILSRAVHLPTSTVFPCRRDSFHFDRTRGASSQGHPTSGHSPTEPTKENTSYLRRRVRVRINPCLKMTDNMLK